MPTRPVSRSVWLVTAAVLAAILLAWSLLAVRTRAGQVADASTSARIQTFAPGVGGIASAVREGLPILLTAGCAVLGVLALLRGRRRALAAAIIVVGVSNLASPAMRHLLTRPYLGNYGLALNTLPSGHATAAASLMVAVVLLWPKARRRWVIAASAVVVALGCLASVVSQAHRLSDVLASVLLVGAVTCITVAVLGPESGHAAPRRKAHGADRIDGVPASTAGAHDRAGAGPGTAAPRGAGVHGTDRGRG